MFTDTSAVQPTRGQEIPSRSGGSSQFFPDDLQRVLGQEPRAHCLRHPRRSYERPAKLPDGVRVLSLPLSLSPVAKKLIHHSFLIFAVHRYYQRIRPNLWQISWVEETGTIVTMALDQEEKRVTTAMFFSYGHWNEAEKAHGYKRDKLDQWRELATIKPEPVNRVPLPEQATIDKVKRGARRKSLRPVNLPVSCHADLRRSR